MLAAFTPAGLSQGPVPWWWDGPSPPWMGTVIVNNRIQTPNRKREVSDDTSDRLTDESEQLSWHWSAEYRGRAWSRKAAPSRYGVRGTCADTGFSRPRKHVRMIRACRRDVPRTYVKLAIIIVAPKKHKTHGLSELDDVGIENGNDHPGTGGARGDRPARRAIRRSDWPARGVPLRHNPVSTSRRPWPAGTARRAIVSKHKAFSFLILSPRKLFTANCRPILYRIFFFEAAIFSVPTDSFCY